MRYFSLRYMAQMHLVANNVSFANRFVLCSTWSRYEHSTTMTIKLAMMMAMMITLGAEHEDAQSSDPDGIHDEDDGGDDFHAGDIGCGGDDQQDAEQDDRDDDDHDGIDSEDTHNDKHDADHDCKGDDDKPRYPTLVIGSGRASQLHISLRWTPRPSPSGSVSLNICPGVSSV